ncbi:hypothetical protein H0H92_003913 [Tricholoma furcatifolium]|nr:hypothetical protein H0H92_003913 [Tricholoma furcatifolium]
MSTKSKLRAERIYSFTPSNPVDMTKERSWPADLVCGPDKFYIFQMSNKSSRYTGTTVDPNFTNISKLPRYAKFGKISSDAPANPEASVPDNNAAVTSRSEDDFKPSRRVRTVPGGPHSDIFGPGDDNDALASAPPRPDTEISEPPAQPTEAQANESESGFKPTRRVRTVPGGASSIASLWDAPEPEEFRPTRRVREGPGGHDNINGIF